MFKRLLLAAALLLVGITNAPAAFQQGVGICETTTTTGTGTLSLAGAYTASIDYLGFASQITSGNTVPYTIESSDGKFEHGLGAFTDGTPDTLTRASEVISSDGVGNKLTLPAGTHIVCLQSGIDVAYTNPQLGANLDLVTFSLVYGATTILSDSAGTTTLSNIDVIDATTESTVEGAIDTLANLTSVQGLTATLTDAGADAVWGWDDSANAYENLTGAEVAAAIGDNIALTTNTTGNYVASVADGTGIDGTASGEGTTYTPTFDSTELTDLTWGAGGTASIAWTFNLSGTDPVITAGSANISITGTLTPEADNTRDLGSTGATWATAHITSVELANTTTNTLSAAGGTLSIEGVALVPATRTLTGGTGIAALGDLSADRTVSFDATEISSATWGAGSFTTFTYDAGATDPTETFGSGTYLLQAVASLRQADAANAGGQLKWLEDPGTGSNFISLLAPASITSDVTCTFENDSNPIPDSCVGDGTDAGGSGAQISGTPSDNQVAVWTNSTTIEGDSAFTFDTSTDTLSVGGDVVKNAGRQTIPLLAGAGTIASGGAIAACTPVSSFDSGTNDVFMRQCSFSASADNALYFTFFFPKSAAETTDLVLQVDWTSATTTDATDDVIWTAAAVCFSNDDAINGNAFPTADTVTDTQTAAGDYLVSGEITAITPAGTPAEGDGCVLRITRDADAAGDNFNGTADFIQARLYYVDNASSDD